MSDPIPNIKQVELSKHFAFMYENFVIATQGGTYLLLENHEGMIDAIHVDSGTIEFPQDMSESAMERQSLDYRLEKLTDPAIDGFVAAIHETYVNGGVLLRCFRPTTTSFDRVLACDPNRSLREFLESESLRDLVPELEITVPIKPFPEIATYNSHEFEGAIVGLLLSSGAYREASIEPTAARKMARSFVDSLLGNQREHACVFRISGAWSGWFCDVAWDSSYAILDPYLRRWWLLCITDTD